MPEMRFQVRWPDGREQSCYSPSLVMHDYLAPGAEYPVDEFVERTSEALTVAGDRVLAKFGMRCTSAAQQMEEIRDVGAAYTDGGAVKVLSMTGADLL
ncbi:MSMEG_0570 family nitrogen starvation response protein [Rhodococcus sp. Eu-32]|uniref:MSMEG_0570 family nitrogen starvation response protein n=1 Tax=Rhodococcus sp. Eu-32 TaxID=1017319 RepID=UPI000DF2C1F1|nr:MSMEG_0570 family nitrogen starvation response protein [Rhodococcus sp. Eu-32]RRQ25360.1 MSMEG_0570 family nitrogen starvation response protein [Rhodococcus sp. Eu-32]